MTMHDHRSITLWKSESISQFKNRMRTEMLVNTHGHHNEPSAKHIWNTIESIDVQYINSFEIEDTKIAIKKQMTSYREDDVVYHINEYGFRGNIDFTTKNNIATFGCSVTYGVGLPESDIYSKLVASTLNKNLFNFGAPGSGIGKMCRYFSSTSDWFNYDTALFVFPNLYRVEHPAIDHINLTVGRNLLPGDETHSQLKTTFMYLDDEHFFVDLYRNLNHILSIAASKNIKVFFSSWSDLTYKHIVRYLGKDSDKLLPIFNDTKIPVTLARDGKHFGKELHKNFANQIIGPLTKSYKN
jgi:hypothetical protein